MSSDSSHNFSDNLSVLSYRPKRRLPTWVYDAKHGTVFGRTGRSFVLIFVFYVIYYALLAGFFMGMLSVFLYLIVPEDYPLRTGEQSLLKFTPGLGMRPNVHVSRSLISYSSSDPQSFEPLVQNIDAFMNSYYDLASKPDDQLATCVNGKKTPDDIDKICKFDLKQLGPCTQENKYGYSSKKPCVFLKVNKIFGWIPDPIDQKQPFAMVTCQGQNPLDKENIGKLKYFPEMTMNGTRGGKFDNIYFPYVGQPGYVGPLVAVQFESLKQHTVVQIECELKNLRGVIDFPPVTFEIVVD